LLLFQGKIDIVISSFYYGRKRRRRERNVAPPFTRVFKTDPTLVINKILEKTLIL
jgi:hypothetical protein